MSKRKRYMKGWLRVLLAGVSLSFFVGQASAQLPFIDRFIEKLQGTDTLEPKPKKPLESFFFDDSLRNRLIFAWNARPGFNQIDTITVDTLPNRFEVDYPFLRPDVGAQYLGNLGGAAQPLNYFIRSDRRDFTFLQAYDSYIFTPENVPYFNVKRPFTHLSWFMSGQTKNAEEQLRVTHAQNVSPSTGMNLHYLNRGTRGMYNNQNAKNKNFSFAASYTGKRYSIQGGYVYNMGNIRENGGIRWDGEITDTIMGLPENIAVKLDQAKNEFKTNTFYVTQAYGIPLQRVTDADLSIADKSSIFVGHAFEYTQATRLYADTRAGTRYNEGNPEHPGALVDYYDHWFFNPDKTRDSLNERKIDNKLFLQIQPWNRDGIIGTIDGGIGFAQHRYYQSLQQNDYIYPMRGVDKSDTYLYGSVQGKLRKYLDWNAGVNYHLAGFRSQDIRLNAELSLNAYIRSRPVTLTVSALMDNRTPDYWVQHYSSNHFVWDNPDFSKELQTRLEAKLAIPSIGLEAAVWQDVTTDKIYYGYAPDPDGSGSGFVGGFPSFHQQMNSTVMPIQHGGTLSVTGVYLMKNFQVGILRLNHRVLVQKSSNEEVLPLPLVSAYAAYFLDFNAVRNVLRLQIGIDGWYHTEYYAQDYNPALMVFHNQNMNGYTAVNDANGLPRLERTAKKIGNYPYLDAFVSAKWKRMRILVKFQHVNEDMFGPRNYFSTPHYPLNKRMFKLGFSWSFYD